MIPFFASAIGFFFAFTSDEKYISAAQLATGITTRSDLPLGDDSYNFRESEIKFNNMLQMLKSNQVVSLVSYKLLLHDLESSDSFNVITEDESDLQLSDPTEFAKLASHLRMKLDSMQVLSNFDEYDRKIFRLMRRYQYDHISLKEMLIIERIKFTDYILISCLTKSPKLSAFIVNELSKEFIRFNAINNLETSDVSVRFFGNLVSQKKKELDEKNQALKEFKASNLVSNYQVQGQAQEQQLKYYEDLKEQEERKIRQTKISINDLEKRISRIQAESTNSELIGEANQKLLKMRNQIQDMNQRYIESGSSNQVLIDSLTNLRREYQLEANRVNSLTKDTKPMQQALMELNEQVSDLNLALEISESALSSIDFKIRTLRTDKFDFASKEVIIDDLQREVDVASNEYISAQERYNSARNKAMAVGSSVKQVMVGQPAYGPESKHVILITLLSGIASFSICVLLIVGFILLDSSIKTPGGFKRATDLKLAGLINNLKATNEDSLDMNEIFKTHKQNEFAIFQNLLRGLRYEIEASRGKIFLFTSTKQGEGKTFSIISLAFSISLINKKILIIDTNFKNNKLTKLLSKQNETIQEKLPIIKLTDLALQGQWNWNSSGGLITPTIYNGIDKIESKASSKSAAEILLEKDFGALLNEVSRYYDYIFMEGAALNDHSDTKELESYADVVIPVFSAKSSLKQMDFESIEYLKTLGPKLFGSILNRVDSEDLKY